MLTNVNELEVPLAARNSILEGSLHGGLSNLRQLRDGHV